MKTLRQDFAFALRALRQHRTFALTAILTAFVWGMVSFAVGPGLQTNAMRRAAEAPLMASTVNQSAFNLGNAFGAWLGGAVIASNMGLPALTWVGALVPASALLVALYAIRRERGEQATAPTVNCADPA